MTKKHLLSVILFLLLLSPVLSITFAQPMTGHTGFPVSEVHNNFNVTWYEISQYPYVYHISVQNLLPEKRDVDVTSIIDSTSFDIDDLSNIEFYEWKNISYVVTVVEYGWESNATHQWKIETGSHEETCYRLTWKSSKMQSFKRTSNSYKSNSGMINIPKYGSKPKDDGTYNGTKWFMIKFDAPMQWRGDGWGSSGRLALTLDEIMFDPWWDSTWSRRQAISINNSASSETFENFTAYIPVTHDADMQADFDDIRFIDSDDTTTLYAQNESITASTIAHLWVRIPSLTSGGVYTIYMYYGNAGASSSWSTAEAWDDDYVGVWHHDETSGNVIDAMDTFNLVPQGGADQSGTLAPDGSDLAAGGGSGDYYTHVDAAGLECGTGNWTMFVVANMSDTNGEGKVMGKSTEGGNYPLYDVAVEDNTGFVKVYFRTSGAAYTLITGDVDVFDEPTLIIGVRDVPGDDINLYVNGTLDETGADNTADIQTTGNFSVFARGNGVNTGKGDITESRLYRGVMSAEWAEAEQLNVFSTWLTFEAEYQMTVVTQCTTIQETEYTTVIDTTSTDVEGATTVTGTAGTTTITGGTSIVTTTVSTTVHSVDVIVTSTETFTESVDLTYSYKTASSTTVEVSTTISIATTVAFCSTYSEYQRTDSTITSQITSTLHSTGTVFVTSTYGTTLVEVSSIYTVDDVISVHDTIVVIESLPRSGIILLLMIVIPIAAVLFWARKRR